MWPKVLPDLEKSCPKVLPDLAKIHPKVLPDWANSHQNDKKSPKWQKFDKVAKNHQIGKKSPKWLKVLKLGSKGFQGVSDGSRSQTAWAQTTQGT